LFYIQFCLYLNVIIFKATSINMKKKLRNLLTYLSLVVLVFLLSEKGFAQTAGSDSLKITSKDHENSLLFKSLKGTDRLAAFKNLQYLIKTAAAGINTELSSSERMGAKPATVIQVKALLGEPDTKIQESLIIYNLKAAGSACKVVIGLNKDGIVTFCTLKDCN